MLKHLPTWEKLTDHGQLTPTFSVCRVPLLIRGVEFAVGEVLAPDAFTNRHRFRQMYQQRRITPVATPIIQADAQRHVRLPITAKLADSFVPLPLDTPSIPVAEESPSRSGYTPSRFKRNARQGVK